MAARISSQARPGETLLSGDTVDLCRPCTSRACGCSTRPRSRARPSPPTSTSWCPRRRTAPSHVGTDAGHGAATIERVAAHARNQASRASTRPRSDVTLGQDRACDLVDPRLVLVARARVVIEVRRGQLRAPLTRAPTDRLRERCGAASRSSLKRRERQPRRRGNGLLGALQALRHDGLVQFHPVVPGESSEWLTGSFCAYLKSPISNMSQTITHLLVGERNGPTSRWSETIPDGFRKRSTPTPRGDMNHPPLSHSISEPHKEDPEGSKRKPSSGHVQSSTIFTPR